MKLNVSMAEAAKMVGIQASKMQELLEEGNIPAWRDGRNWKIPISALTEWNESRAYTEAGRRKYESKGPHNSVSEG